MAEREVLSGGVANAGAVIREGKYVLRPANRHTETIHAFLRHLRATGFDGVPEPVAVEADGRERLIFIPGDVALPPYPAWSQTDAALASVAALLARFHEASKGFQPLAAAQWSQDLADPEDSALICHNDVCLENVVFRDGVAVALLDFDFAAPGRPLFDLAVMARMCIPLDVADDAKGRGWTSFDPFARLHLVADSYGLPPGREELVSLIEESMARGEEFVRRRVERGEPGFVEMWEQMGGQARFDRRREWFVLHRSRFLARVGTLDIVVDLMEAVPALLRQAAHEAVLPVFGMREARPEEKSPGEWVTTADRAAEVFLAPRLAALVPDSVVVGEEAAASNPHVLDQLATGGYVWLLDPLDGTVNFAAGVSPFSIMAALLHAGETIASWMLDPLTGLVASAERGAGAWLDDERIQTDPSDADVSALRGAVLRRFLPSALLSYLEAVEPQFMELTAGSRCAGHDYPEVAQGKLDFALYWRTLPWDHIPGALFVSEAGGVVARLDGSGYTAATHARSGLLVARNPAVWTRVRDALIPERYQPSVTP